MYNHASKETGCSDLVHDPSRRHEPQASVHGNPCLTKQQWLVVHPAYTH